MWRNQDGNESDSDASEKIRQKKKGRFRTVCNETDDCEVFDTEIVDSDEPLSDEEKEEMDETIMTETDFDETIDIEAKPKKAGMETFEDMERIAAERA